VEHIYHQPVTSRFVTGTYTQTIWIPVYSTRRMKKKEIRTLIRNYTVNIHSPDRKRQTISSNYPVRIHSFGVVVDGFDFIVITSGRTIPAVAVVFIIFMRDKAIITTKTDLTPRGPTFNSSLATLMKIYYTVDPFRIRFFIIIIIETLTDSFLRVGKIIKSYSSVNIIRCKVENSFYAYATADLHAYKKFFEFVVKRSSYAVKPLINGHLSKVDALSTYLVMFHCSEHF